MLLTLGLIILVLIILELNNNIIDRINKKTLITVIINFSPRLFFPNIYFILLTSFYLKIYIFIKNLDRLIF